MCVVIHPFASFILSTKFCLYIFTVFCNNIEDFEGISMQQLYAYAGLNSKMTELQWSTQAIVGCSLAQLESHEQRLTFYGNLVTLLTLHALLWNLWQARSSQEVKCF